MAADVRQTASLNVVANMDVSNVIGAVGKIEGAFKGLKINPNLTADIAKEFTNLRKLLDDYRKGMEKGSPSTKADIKNMQKLENAINSSFSRLGKLQDEFSGRTLMTRVDSKALDDLIAKTNEAKDSLNNVVSGINISGKTNLGTLVSDLDKAAGRSKVLKEGFKEAFSSLQTGDVDKFKGQLDGLVDNVSKRLKKGQLEKPVQEIINNFKQLGLIKADIDTSTAGEKIVALKTGVQELKRVVDSGVSTEGIQRYVNELNNALKAENDFRTAAEKRGKNTFNDDVVNQTNQIANGFREDAAAAREFAQASMSAAQQVQDLQQSTQYFFSLRNMINLLKRGIDEAVQSVKDLDAAMTETAVVTDYKVSDMWGMLPEYTKIANELGATTQGAYETMTLYYQQGLDQQQAFALGTETMKMARIAGLDYAESTDMMTAALRGFNMELDETSAKRVNDVYSELAAITASDTEELGSAMQRTASIAHSAGASFEGTTAFLAQAIETTREPAENIGTAMKTIVARFQEMKKNPLEVSEVEGEEVDYNKIDAALKTIGVDLKDTNGQFRDFDDVMLDISARWDGLSQAQQRYIATTAAGSRQQSRFIAMVSNYDRTMQLMEAANNSAGASDEQFGKTMDSLEAKLNQLHNAWQAFTMGIANNSMIKLAVDGLTGLLTGVNNIIDALSLGIGPLESFLSIFTAFVGLKAGGRVINRLIGGLGGLIDPASTFKQGFFGGGISGNKERANMAQAHAISNPIVEAIHQLQVAITKESMSSGADIKKGANTFGRYEDFKTGRKDLRDFLQGTKAGESFSISEAYGKISKLNDKQQSAILQQLPGLGLSLRKNGIKFDTKGLSKDSQKIVESFVGEVNKNLSKKSLSAKDALQIFGTPENLKQAMSAHGPEYANAIKEALFDPEYYQQQYNKYWEELNVDENYLGHLGSEEALEARTAELKDLAEQKATTDANSLAMKELEKRVSAVQAPGAQLANSIGKIGELATSAGQGVAQLGYQLTNIGFEKIGASVTSLGYSISSLGQIASSVGDVVGRIAGAGGPLALISAHPLAALGVAAVGTMAAIVTATKMHEKNAREAAEKLKEDFDTTINGINEKIDSLNNNKIRFSELAEGVDEYGNNINLTNEEYDEYLTLSREIANIAPELISGYNAEGEALIANGDAIDELIKKQKELKKQEVKEYTTNDAFNTTLEGIQASDAYKEASPRHMPGESGKLFDAQSSKLITTFTQTGIELNNAQQVIGRILGEPIDLRNLTTNQIQAIGEHYDNIAKAIEAEEPKLSKENREVLENAFADFGSDWTGLTKEAAPLIEQIQQYLSLQNLDAEGLNLGQEFISDFNKGLEKVALKNIIENKDITPGELKSAAEEYAEAFGSVTEKGSEYQKILKDVDEAEKTYLENIDNADAFNTYENNIKGCSNAIKELAESYRDGTTAGEILYDTLIDKANALSRSTQEPIMSIGEALNTMADNFATARAAYKDFSDSTENKNYSDAAKGMAKIYEEAMTDEHAEAYGDNTFWTGARYLLSEKKAEQSAAQVRQAMKNVEPLLKEGEEGYNNFVNAIHDLSDKQKEKLKDFGAHFDKDGYIDKISEQSMPKLAEYLGISENLLASLIDKAQQFAQISFENVGALKDSLRKDETAFKAGNGKILVKEENFDEELRQQYPNWSKERRQAKKDEYAEKAGLVYMPTAEEVEKKGFDIKEFRQNLVDAGIKTQEAVLKSLGETGVYTKEDLEAYSKAVEGEDYNAKAFEAGYKSILDHLDNDAAATTNDHLATIEGYVATLAAEKTQENLSSGNATAEDFVPSENLRREVYGKEGVADTPFQLFSLGKGANGKNISAKEYETTRKDITDALITARKTSESLSSGLKEIDKHSQPELYEKYTRELAANENFIKNLNNFLKTGDQAYNKQEEEQAKIDNYKPGIVPADINQQVADLYDGAFGQVFSSLDVSQINTEEKKAALADLYSKVFSNTQPTIDEVYQDFNTLGLNISDAINAGLVAVSDNLFGNTNLGNGQPLEWGSNPSKNPNFNAAYSWYKNQYSSKKEFASSLTGSHSTYMSGTVHAEDANGAIEIAVNPMLKTEDGTSQVLSKDAVNKYVQDVVAQATDENGVVNLDEVMQIDKTNAQKEGQEIGGIFMGAFAGEGAGEKADALGALGQDLSTAAEQGAIKLKGVVSEADQVRQGLANLMGGNKLPQQGPSLPQRQPQQPQQKQPEVQSETPKFKVETGDTLPNLEEIQKKGKETTDLLNAGAKYKIDVSGKADLENAAKSAKKIAKASGKTSVDLSANVSGTKDAATFNKTVGKAADLKSKSVKLEAKAKGESDVRDLISEVNTFKGLGDDTVTLTTKKVTEYSTVRKPHTGGFITTTGLEYRAKGGSIFKKKGTDTVPAMLTPGEYVQKRSAVKYFGVDFMRNINNMNLPGALASLDKQKTAYRAKGGAVSYYGGGSGGDTVNGPLKPTKKQQTSSSGGGSTNSGKTDKKSDSDKKTTKTTKKILDKVGKLALWWENNTRKMDGLIRQASKITKQIESAIAKIGATLGQSAKNINNFFKTNASEQSQAIKMQQRADKKLKTISTSKTAKTTVSYEATKVTKKKGKKKKEKVTKKAKVNLSKYITYDALSDSYQVNDTKIKKDFKIKKGKNKGKLSKKGQAVGEKANKLVDEYTQKRNTAADNLEKAQEEAEKLGKLVYDTFYGWETSLNRIWSITQKIENAQNLLTRFEKYQDLLEKQVSSGYISDEQGIINNRNERVDIYKKALDQRVDAIKDQAKALPEYRNQIERFQSGSDIQEAINAVNARTDLDAASKAGILNGINEEAQTRKEALATYTKIIPNSDGTLNIQFNEEAFRNDKLAGNINENLAKAIEDDVNKLKEYSDGLNDTLNSMTENITELYSILEELETAYHDAAQEFMQSLEEENKQEIDELKSLSDEIANAFKDLIDKVKQAINDRRQQEDNAKTEQDIANKQQRLALLRANTSGGNAVEIARLEKEIADAQQSYGRTLEDQLLDKLQQQGDEAAKQRDEQIKLQEDLLEATNNAALVDQWMQDPETYREDMRKAYYKSQGYDKADATEKKAIKQRFEELYGTAVTYKQNRDAVNTAIVNTSKEQALIKTAITDLGTSISTSNTDAIKQVAEQATQAADQANQATDAENKRNAYYNYLKGVKSGGTLNSNQVNELYSLGKAIGYSKKKVISDIIGADGVTGLDPFTWKNNIKAIIQSSGVSRYDLLKTFPNSTQLYNAVAALNTNATAKEQAELLLKAKDLSQYKTGGLAPYTGPAWLDGTPSKPELVLNAADTKNFIQLKDILSRRMNTLSDGAPSYGDMTYEININVEKLTSDYDVDKVAERVKKIIVKDSTYRNVTQVRKFR